MWSSTDPETKHARSTAKQVVAFLKLFLERGFKLVESSPQYRDDVLTLGESAETALLTFLKQHNITARGPQNVLNTQNSVFMPSIKPTKNAVSFYKEFKSCCIATSKTFKLRISDEAIRHLRPTMNTTVASAALLPEAINVICDSLSERKTSRASLEDVREWLVEPPPAEPGDAATEGEQKHYVRKLLNWKRQNRETFYLINWEPTWEPRHHLHASVVAAFEKERRLLVRKKIFEDEAVEGNTLNETEA
ncbi:hypothetical protein PPTG_04221 [Phytophthora nicotianae INRA-310]|uniref:Chromo domain-containing protein n=1 Tax=Phytophthora nicotianae (strain INRA-310) TaxID=761204 RepID=W2R004_PHYN3|nr:hypothetical protein PPTG_04221 [Phytophthora nicotianae INRA-310]ETN18703.1 hypothetical protein PPTG_04221 [Phytophthora nicotianae INRA-310]